MNTPVQHFPFPLYHGTSDACIDSIKTHGLGGFDLRAHLRAWEAFQDLDRFLVAVVGDDVTETAQRNIRNKNSRYQFGPVFVTTSFDVAVGFGEREGGSGELVGLISRMLAKATEHGYKADAARFPVFEVLHRTAAPVVLAIDYLPIESLKHESGALLSPDYAVNLQTYHKEREKGKAFGPNECFRVTGVVPWPKLRVIKGEELEQARYGLNFV